MRFKELRGLMITILLALIDVACIVYSISMHDKVKCLIAVVLGGFILMSYLTQFYVRVMSDCILFYHFAGITLLPKILNFSDILQVSCQTKHKVRLVTKDKHYHIYVWHAEKLYQVIEARLSMSNG